MQWKCNRLKGGKQDSVSACMLKTSHDSPIVYDHTSMIYLKLKSWVKMILRLLTGHFNGYLFCCTL